MPIAYWLQQPRKVWEGGGGGVRKVESGGWRETRRTPEGAHTATTQAVHTQSANPPVGLWARSISKKGGMAATTSSMANTTSSLAEKWQENYHYVFTELRDPR